MSEDTRFVTLNKDKVIFEFRSEVNNHLAPNVTLISSDNVKVKGHSIILASCQYFKELFNKDKTGNPQLVFHENLTGDVLEFVVKYIYTGEYSMLDADKLPEVIRATSKEKFNIPALAKGYLLKQLDAPGGLNQANWHLFYQNGIKLSSGEEYYNLIYEILSEKHSEFYKSEEFKSLTFDQICKIMNSPNRPFASTTTIMEATLIWATENKAGMDKLAELSKICTNPFQNGNPNPILDSSVQSANNPLSICPQPTSNSDRNTRKRTRSISPQINTNLISKKSNKEPNLNDIARNSTEPNIMSSPHHHYVSDSRSATNLQPQNTSNSTPSTSTASSMRTRAHSLKNGTPNLNLKKSVVEVYHPPKYSWESAQLLFFGKIKGNKHGYLWSYTFQTGEIKKMTKIPIDNLEDPTLLASQDLVYSIGGRVWQKGYGYKEQDLVWSFATNDLKNMNKTWDEEPNLTRARGVNLTLLFRNTIYLFPKDGMYFKSEKWDIDGNPGIWKKNNWDMLYDRDSLGVALLDNVIYMIGGYGAKNKRVDLEDQALDTAECYNIDDGTQSLLPNMNQARIDLLVVALEGRIYAIGGYNDDSDELTSVESYKPGDSSWKQVANMNHPKANGSAFVLDDMIYVVGDNTDRDGTCMERYCPQKNIWTMVDANLPNWAFLSSTVLLGPNNF